MSINITNTTDDNHTLTQHAFCHHALKYSQQSDSTNDYSAAIIEHNKYSFVSDLTTTNQVDTDINNDDNIQSFATTRKHNHSTTEICGTNTTTN